MNDYQKMFKKIIVSSPFDQAKRFVGPLEKYLGINHFWYYFISNTGDYSYFGSHVDWSEFCFEQNLLVPFACLRHPTNVSLGLSLMKAESNSEFQHVLKLAWERFQINFNINIVMRNPAGIEGFGFGSKFNDAKSDERLINQLPLLKMFFRSFREKNRKIFSQLEENKINISSEFGSIFYEKPKHLCYTASREEFLYEIGYGDLLSLSSRENDVLRYVAEGYPAPYIAKQLELSSRTVENYIANLKDKLLCDSKIELIQKAKALKAEALIEF